MREEAEAEFNAWVTRLDKATRSWSCLIPFLDQDSALGQLLLTEGYKGLVSQRELFQFSSVASEIPHLVCEDLDDDLVEAKWELGGWQL
jgi:hypothetical protein